MRPVLSEQARLQVQATPVRDHVGWQTILYDRAWLHNHPASATRTEIPMEMYSAQILEFIGFDDNTVGELYDSWYPEGEDSLLHHAKEYLAKIYSQVPGPTELRRLLPAMGMSRAFNNEIWEMADQIRRDHRFANTIVERSNIMQWAAVEIEARFKNLQNLNNQILGRRIETVYQQASYKLSHKKNGNSNDGAPDGFLKRNGLLEPTFHQFPQLPAGPRIWAFNPAMMGNFRAAPMEDGRIKYVAQEPTGYTVPNSDGTRSVYVGRHQPPPGYDRNNYAAQEPPTGYTVPNDDGTQNVYVGRHQPHPGYGPNNYVAHEPTGYIVPNGDGTQKVYVGRRQPPTGYGRVEFVAQKPTGYIVPNSDDTQNFYVGRHQPSTGYGGQHGRGGAPNFGQGQPLDESDQARLFDEAQSQAQRGGQYSAWDGPAPGMQQAVARYVNPQGNGAAPNLSVIPQNRFHVQDQLRAQLGGQHPAWNGPAPNVQPRGHAPAQLGPQVNASVGTNRGRNRTDVDAAPPPYSAQHP